MVARIYRLTVAGREAWEGEDAAVPADYRRILWMMDLHGSAPETLEILPTANPNGAVGQPWVYDEDGQVDISLPVAFIWANTASMKSLTGGAVSCSPFPPRSVFSAGGIISITSMFRWRSKYRSDNVKE